MKKITKSMGSVVKGMDQALKSLDLEKMVRDRELAFALFFFCILIVYFCSKSSWTSSTAFPSRLM